MWGQNQKARRGLGEIQSLVFIHAPQHTLRKNQKGPKPDLVVKARGSIRYLETT